MNQKKKTIVLWGVIIVLAAAVVALSVILVTKSRKNNYPDGQKNAGTEAVIEESGQDTEQKDEDGADQKKEKGASDTQKSTDDKKTLYAEVTVGSTWENNGMTAATETITIYNKTDKAATDWSVDLEFSGKVTIDQLWNGKYTADGSVVHVTAESYNEEIPAGGSIDFGYNLSASDVKPVRCTLMIAGKEVTTVTGDDQSVDSDKKDQSGSDKDTAVVTLNGESTDKERYRQFYSFLLNTTAETVKLDGEPAGEMLGEIHVKTQDGKFERDLQFYAIDEFTCLITADGKSAYTCRKTYLDTLLNNMNIYDDTSQDFTTNWS